MTILSVREALRHALKEELRRDDKVFLLGESIAAYGGCFKITEGLLAEFGAERIQTHHCRSRPSWDAELVLP